MKSSLCFSRQRDPVADFLKKWLPEELAVKINRWKQVFLGFLFYQFCVNFPDRASNFVKEGMQKQIGTSMTRSELFLIDKVGQTVNI